MKTAIKNSIAAFLVMILCVGVSPFALAAFETAAPTTTIEALAELSPADKYRAEVLRLVNIERVNAGIAELTEMKALQPMAYVRASESAIKFSHTRPNEKKCFSIFEDNAMTYRTAGENLGSGFNTPEKLVAAWMNSESHRYNLLNPNFLYIGIGYYTNDNGRIYCSQLFYTPKTTSAQ